MEYVEKKTVGLHFGFSIVVALFLHTVIHMYLCSPLWTYCHETMIFTIKSYYHKILQDHPRIHWEDLTFQDQEHENRLVQYIPWCICKAFLKLCVLMAELVFC